MNFNFNFIITKTYVKKNNLTPDIQERWTWVRTILFGPSDVVREKARNDIVVDGGAMIGDRVGNHFGDINDVSGKEASIWAGDALTFH